MGKGKGKKFTKITPETRPPQAPPGGGDVPDGIQNAGGWGDGRRKI